MEYKYTQDGQDYTIQLNPQPDGRYEAIIGDETFIVSVQRHASGEMTFLVDDSPHKAFIATEKATAQKAATHFLAVDGQKYELTKVERGAARRSGSAGASGSLNAQMPGQIIQVMVSEGDEVEAGQTLILMEAMKMEIRVNAPADGVVKSLSVKEGDTVDRGQTLVEIE